MTSNPPTDAAPGSDPATWLDRYGDVLYRHALMRVRRQDVAEDLVQETLLAALGARNRFSGKSSEQTWLISILRRKIVDHFRKASRMRVEDVGAGDASDFFTDSGKWAGRMKAWRCEPCEVLENREFWEVLDLCLSDLPMNVADAFVLKELDAMERTDVCEHLEITPSNLSVRLHRARLLLQRCLDFNWFSGKKKR